MALLVHTNRGTRDRERLRPARLSDVTDPLSTVAAHGNHHYLLSAIPSKQSGGPADTAWHRVAGDALGAHTSIDTTCLLTAADVDELAVEDCHYRMLKPPEIKAGMGIRHDFAMWDPARNQVRALGNAVTPPVATAIITRLAAVLDHGRFDTAERRGA